MYAPFKGTFRKNNINTLLVRTFVPYSHINRQHEAFIHFQRISKRINTSINVKKGNEGELKVVVFYCYERKKMKIRNLRIKLEESC